MESQSSPQERTRQAFFALAVRQLPKLYRLIRPQLEAYETAGELMPGELSAEDVIDEVLLRAYSEFVRDPDKRRPGSRLERLAQERLESEVRRLGAERACSVHIEEDIPETPPAEAAATLGEEILYFHQPDEDLKVEDVMPAVTPRDPLEASPKPRRRAKRPGRG
jgi:DNA-directed RNA polymerase specialized sigma24 family protein